MREFQNVCGDGPRYVILGDVLTEVQCRERRSARAWDTRKEYEADESLTRV